MDELKQIYKASCSLPYICYGIRANVANSASVYRGILVPVVKLRSLIIWFAMMAFDTAVG